VGFCDVRQEWRPGKMYLQLLQLLPRPSVGLPLLPLLPLLICYDGDLLDFRYIVIFT
jgi:hypothetical protein